jgi:hypothetical protein
LQRLMTGDASYLAYTSVGLRDSRTRRRNLAATEGNRDDP